MISRMKYRLPWNRNTIVILSLALFLFLEMGCSNEESSNSQEQVRQGRTLDYTREITFLNHSGDPITTIEVAVADDNNERNTGLMDVNNLPADKGMLFIFDNEQPRSFWMANTPLTLDIIFVNSDLEIVRIHHNTQPFAEENFTSGDPAKYVVETNGGFCISHDIQEGMKIEM